MNERRSGLMRTQIQSVGIVNSRNLPKANICLTLFLPFLFLMVSLGGCVSLRSDLPRDASQAIADVDGTILGRVYTAQAAENPGMSGFQIIDSGQAAFMARAALADTAERTLDLQYYSVGDDLTTNLLLLRVIAAAERGVRVRILLDDIYAPTRVFAWRAMAAHRGIQVRLFNPFFFGGTVGVARLGEFIVDGERLNRRMHNKLWVTDNVVALVGSRNLGDEYFDAKESGNFYDVDLLAAGPIVKDVSRAFDAYWNSAAVIPMEAIAGAPDAADGDLAREALRTRTAVCQGTPPCRWLNEGGLVDALRIGGVSLSWASAQFIYDQPDQDKALVASGIVHGAIDDHPSGMRTQNELLIVSPYFVPSEDGRRHLAEMQARGVRIAVLTNSLASTDVPAAHAGYARHRTELLRSGVELYEVRPEPGQPHLRSHRWKHASSSSLHAKIIVQDRKRVIVGSLNQDPRSQLHNTEAWIVIDSTVIAADLAALFEEGTDLQHAFKLGRSVTSGTETLEWITDEGVGATRYDMEPMTSFWLRLWQDFLGVLVPEHLL
jgi:putative cardiolipin synthase